MVEYISKDRILAGAREEDVEIDGFGFVRIREVSLLDRINFSRRLTGDSADYNDIWPDIVEAGLVEPSMTRGEILSAPGAILGQLQALGTKILQLSAPDESDPKVPAPIQRDGSSTA